MEYNHKCPSKWFRIELMKLLPLLLDEKPDDGEALAVTPSSFMKEMVLTTEQRLEKLKGATRKVKVRREELSLNTFKAVPDIVIFQNFEVGGVYTVPLTLLNTSEVSKPLKIIWEPSPAFKISHSTETVCTKVAPGMAYQFSVTLSVSVVEDHNHKITFATDGDVFEVPLVAISPRPLLDLPDFIAVPTVPVKIPSERTILVRNLGKVPAVFNLRSGAPYSVSPTRGVLEPNQCMQLCVYFNTKTIGCHRGQVFFTYQTGEQLTVGLHGCSVQANIYLDKTELQMADVFMGLKTREFIRLVNKSDHVVRFQFKLYKNEAIEKEESEKHLEGFEMIKENEQGKFFGLVESGVVENRQTHETIYERIHVDEVHEYETTDQFVYKNPTFEIFPGAGEIWPDNDAQILVVFSPAEAKAYESVAYLEVTGREKRTPLKLKGSGVGPLVQLNVEEIDANEIFLCAAHQYEITVRNIGDIPANVTYFPAKPNFGGEISFTPEKWYLEPDGYASFVMQFSSGVQGKFVEEINFVVEESDEIITFIFKGDIVCPVLNFDVTELSFQNVPLGFVVKKELRLINTTQVPIEFNMSVEPDGFNAAMSCEEYAKCVSKPKISNPKEFTVSHVEGVAKPNSSVCVEVSLLPNKEGPHAKELKVQMWKSNKHCMSLPIKYYCHVPHIACETKELLVRGCFINYFYNRTVVLKNKNSYRGYFVILPQDDSDNEGVIYFPKISEDFIEPYEEKEVEIEISTNVVGQSVAHLFLSVFGENPKFHLCTIVCNGQGPVLSIPESLNFGNIKTLKRVTETIEVVNDSPVVAHVTVYKSSKSTYEIEKCDFELEPSAKKDLAVKMYFREPGAFVEKIVFDVENSEKASCVLKTVAVGSSLLSEPELDGEYDIGTVFTYHQYIQTVRFTNMGGKQHKIMWSRKKTIRSWRESDLDVASIFSLVPNRFELAPGQSIECALQGQTKNCGRVEEDFYCHALIGNKKESGVVASFIITAEFVGPVLEISKDMVEFRIDRGVNNIYEYLFDSIVVKNTSKIPVAAKINLDVPFYVVRDDGRVSSVEINIEHEELIELTVEFVPVSETKRCMVSEGVLEITYSSHPNKVKMLLRGEENYPNVELEPRVLNFGCSPNFFTSSKLILVRNISPLPVSYHWEWIEDKFRTEQLDVVPINFPEKIVSTSDYLQLEENSEHQLVYRRSDFPDKKIEEDVVVQTGKIDMTRKSEYFKEVQVLLYQLVAKFDSREDDDSVALRCLQGEDAMKSQVQEILELAPSYGYLGPFESQIVSVEFSPCPNTFVQGIAHCHVAGGDVEVVPVSGKASNISFSLDKTFVDFGRTLFCDASEQEITLENTGFSEFRYRIRGCSGDYGKSVLPRAHSLFVAPTEGVLLPRETKHLQIKYFPGLTGEFTREFTLEIAHLNPYTIRAHGYAVPAQIICSLPRPSAETEEINLLSYGAIGAITDELLNEVKSHPKEKKYESDSCKDHLKDEGWVVITYNNLCPSVHDIDLAINRKLINEYLLCKPSALEEHTVCGKLRILPQLALLPYLVDFGYVIRDTIAHRTVLLENYGPVASTLRVQPAKVSPHEGAFDVQITSVTLKVGDVAQLFIVFRPVTKIFPTVNQEVKHKIYLSSAHSPRIPIEIKAFLTLPEITVPKNALVFEPTAMGNCVRKTIGLQNDGFVRSKFVCKVHTKSKPSPPFYVKTEGGCCEPGELFPVDVYFEPKTEGKLRGRLVVSVEHNQAKFVVHLKGASVKPALKITDQHVRFPPTLPYAPNVQLRFTVENTCPFPIEYFFPDFDEAVDLEEQILRVLMDYYKAKQVYLPMRTPGSGLPLAILDFYYRLLGKVKEKTEGSSTVSLANGGGDRAKHKKSSHLGHSASSINGPPVKHNWEEILCEQLDELKWSCAEERPDPIRDALAESRPPIPEVDSTNTRAGILLIFHGSSGINCSQIANRAGLDVKLPVHKIDELLLDALIEANSLAAIKILEIIEDDFKAAASESDLVNPPHYDERDELQKKIGVVLSGKSKKEIDSKKVKDKESKSSGKASKGSLKDKGKKKSGSQISSERTKSSKDSKRNKAKERDTLLGIPEDFIFEILQTKLRQFKNGLVVEGLDSAFLRQPLLVLDYLLKGIGNVQYIHCVVFSQTYNDHVKHAEIERHEEQEKIAEMKKTKAEATVEMGADSFENLTEEDKAFFKQEVLVPRKLNTLRKREQLKLRLEELKKKKGKLKPTKKDAGKRLSLDRKKIPKESKSSKQSKPKASKSNKASKTSRKSGQDKSSKGSKKGKTEKITEEELEIKKAFANSEKLCGEIVHTLEFWDRKNSCPTKSLPEKFGERGASRKSNKSSNKSSKGSTKTTRPSEANLKITTDVIEDDVRGQREPTEEELQLAKQIGIPCWYVNDVRPGKIEETGEQILFYLKHTPELQNAKAELNVSSVQKPEWPTEVFSCVLRPAKTREKHTSSIFTLTNETLVKEMVESKQDSVIFSSHEITTRDSKATANRKRKHARRSRSRQSLYSIDNRSFISQTKSRSSDSAKIKDSEAERKLTSRNVLNPGEVVTYCVTFLPKECGSYQHRYSMELVGWPSRYEILLEGSCDIPRINMKETVLFDECVARKERGKLFQPNLFVTEMDVFDFGPILIPPVFIHLENPSVLERVSAFHLENISTLPCEATLSLRNNADTTFQTENNALSIGLNEIKDVRVSAFPEKVGANENRLVITLKNNPRVEVIDLRCVGCEIDFRVDPRIVSFERGLLNVANKKLVKLCNESLVPVVWKISGAFEDQDFFRTSDVCGRIAPCSKQKLEITFKPNAQREIPKREMEIKVYDERCKLGQPIFSDTLEISAEVINVDIDFPSEINFGEVKGRTEHSFEFPILSKVKYDIEFSFSDIAPYDNYYEHEAIRKMFRVTPTRTFLKCDKKFYATVTFLPKRAVNFVDVPIFQCVATDPVYKCVIKSTILKATAKTYLPSYELCPPDEVDFNHQLVGTENFGELILKNTGKFEFTYAVLSLSKILGQKEKKAKGKGDKAKKNKKKSSKSSSKSSKKSDTIKTSKSSKASKGSKMKGKKNKKGKGDTDRKAKTKPTKLDVGCFSVVSSTGVVEPNDRVSIKITSKPKLEKAYEEKICFFISECSERKGHTITLSVKGAIPKFNFQNFTDIFNEHYVVNRIEDFACPEQLDFHCVYITGEQTLYFNKVCINTAVEARIRLQNVGLVPIELVAEVNPKKVFSVKTSRVPVEPFNYAYVTLSFTPNEINVFTAVLEVTCETSPEKLQVQLSGEGFVPEIAILDPERDSATNAYQLLFEPTLVGKHASKRVCLENCGIVACRVILEICQDTQDALSLKPGDWLLVKKIWNADVSDMKHTMVISLRPKQKGIFEVEFKPESELKLSSALKLHVVNNPFEVFSIHISASSFLEDIVLEGLPSKAAEKSQFPSRYELNFGFCAMNALQKKRFKIKNCSQQLNIYRFEFTNYDKLIFIPAVGHLKPGACKEVLATFLTREPVNFNQETLNCVTCKIEYVHHQCEALSWDQRQNLIVWDRSSDTSLKQKVKSTESAASGTKSRTSKNSEETSETGMVKVRKLENRSEPEYLEVPESTRILQLSLSITADYCSYECDAKEIVMEDTLMFEKRSSLFSVANTSTVPLYLEWQISMDESYPRRINSPFESSVPKVMRSSQSAKLTFVSSSRPGHLTGKESFLPDECTPPASTKSSLFSSSGSVTSRTNDSWCERDLVPFAVAPTPIEIPPFATQAFTVTFSPNDVFQYVAHLKSDVQNSKPQNRALDVTVSARSLLPRYHFDLESSNYLRKKRTCASNESEDVKVVEFEAIGLGVATTKSFRIINPTGENFEYQWTPSETNGALFQCHTPKGEVARGKMAEATFSFLPQEIGTFEASYTFHIGKYDLKSSFLLVGVARNPCVFFSRPHLKLKPTILKMDVGGAVSLKNNENLELAFEFAKSSLYSGDRTERLHVKPSRGSLTAHGEIPIQITHRPIRTGEVAFRLECYVELLRTPLNVTVTANCFDLQPEVLHVGEDGATTLDPQKTTNVLLDSVRRLQTILTNLATATSRDVNFTIRNRGKVGFYFGWSCKEKFLDDYVKLEFKDSEGYVSSSSENNSVVVLKPSRTLAQRRIKTKLQIRYGPSYSVCLICTTVKTKYKFSLCEYDFGPCLLQQDKTTYYRCNLEFTNCDASPLILEYASGKCDHLSVMFKAKEIAPRKTEQIIIYFHPLQIGTYADDVCFFVDSKLDAIKIRGEGVPVSIEVENPCDKVVDFGSVMAGKKVSKVVKVVNRSVCSAYVIFELYDRLPYLFRPKKVLDPEYERELPKKPTLSLQKKSKEPKKKKKKSDVSVKASKKSSKSTRSSEGKKSKRSKKSESSKRSKGSKKSGSSKSRREKVDGKDEQTQTETKDVKTRRLIQDFTGVIPRTFIKLLPGGKCEFAIKFSPKQRMSSFTEKIYYQVQDYVDTVCVFKAACIASDYHLSSDKITFGNVIKGNSAKGKVTLYNIGDIGGKYVWKFAKGEHPFTIVPMEGYLSPDTSVAFAAKFQPLRTECLIKVKATCSMEHFDKKLEITLSGTCVNLPLPEETLHFTCPVRSETKTDVSIKNPTNTVWYVTPVIKDDYFYVPEEIKIEPRSSANCEVTYRPKTMSFNYAHKTSLFLKLSNGGGVVYNLEGRSEKPLPSGRIERDVFCKTYHTEILRVQNWLSAPQQFRVVTDNLRPLETVKQLYKLTGNSVINVPGKGERHYKWTLHALNEGALQFKVSFVNDATQEYLFYEVHLNVIQCESIGEITLKTCARVPVFHVLKLENPIKKPVAFSVTSGSDLLRHDPLIAVPPLREELLSVEYLPLFEGETQTILEVASDELGKYPYKFRLISGRAVPEPPVHVKTCLGQRVVQKIGLRNITRAKAEFLPNVENGEQFSVDSPISIGPEQTGFFEITFEPDGLGSFQSTLTLNSNTAGEYIYPLIGTSTLPKPQGPVHIRPSGGASVINFKNPFNETLAFIFTVEPKEFYLKTYSESVKAKTTTKINVFLRPVKKDGATNFPLTGKITVSCVPSDLSQITWVYYLQADLDNNSSVL